MSCKYICIKCLLTTLSFLFLVSTVNAQNIKNNDPHIHYMGRVFTTDSSSQLQWSGTSVKLNFKGTGIKVWLRDEHGSNLFNVIVDEKVTSIITLDSIKREYVLANGLHTGNHSVELFKRTEAETGKTWLYEFVLDSGSRVLPAPKIKKRKIEFYGNSITCGMAMADTVKGKNGGENNYLAYGAITARHFNAEYSCISRSGIGLMVSWFPLIMPEMYDRLDESDPDSKWDFLRYAPDIVVINLGQNDSWIVKQPANGQFKARFGTNAPSAEQIISAYVSFIKMIRSKYPKAKIICALGSMDAAKADSPWPGYIEKAIRKLSDRNIYSLIFPYDPVGNPYAHPSVAQHQQMADQLIAFIDNNIKW